MANSGWGLPLLYTLLRDLRSLASQVRKLLTDQCDFGAGMLIISLGR
jgi:hypothetical protein